ncbi:21929_t:CDS:2 [Gigaspora margarita]|uniref:21929_t:CDS:1 n=1 Tax=Gigaspora margarita TaxID=4874 RepID=A0ABN7V0X2_GIGMA|nr:21929_t:CDS:2 [Gigaspora margarita]
MSNSSKKNLSTLSKANKSKLRKVDTDDQSTLASSVITGLINDVVERAKSKIPLSNNNNLEPELQDPESELQEFEYTSVCKHVFAIYQKFYQRPITYSTSNQVEKKSVKACDITFNCWVEALKKVWDRHTQEDQNQITDADIEAIVEAGMKRKANISLYDNF